MAIVNADGQVEIGVNLRTKDAKKSINELRSEAMKLAAEYRKAGMSQSEAQKKAYRSLRSGKRENHKILYWQGDRGSD